MIHLLVLSASIGDRLIAALRAGEKAGGDSRGLMSAALLILPPDSPPLTLRVDFDETPIDRLELLLQKQGNQLTAPG